MSRIFDAVYGYVELNEVEFALVNSPIFQRLHWIKQLGPLHTIFPSAQHSRFSHSIGVFYIMGKMIKHLENSGYISSFSKDDQETLKLAALLHDIGHVPLSHVGEIVLKKSFKPTTESEDNIAGDKLRTWKALFPEKYAGGSKLHELLSVEIVLKSKEIEDIFKKYKYETDRRETILNNVAKIIVGKHEKQVFNALLHSELDADRLDYLLRDSFFTGVGYGHVDLDYIISRICPEEDNDGITQLCFESKGLHTIEHYILGRFFLQTQVILNRKVRFLDLAFEDVMKYMTEYKRADFHIMDLQELLYCIHCEGSDQEVRDSWHKLYMYTDAEIFAKMRGLHEVLDKKEKDNNATEEEKYINDRIKIIMAGDVRDPAGGTFQKLVPIGSLDDREYVENLKKESKQIAKEIASKNSVYEKRIKPNISEQLVMKYTKIEEEEENLKEAVRIANPTNDGKIKVIYAAESRATILGGLVDKKLLVFNVYYVRSKSAGESDESVTNNETVIKQGFEDFVSRHFLGHKEACGCDSGTHLCQMHFNETELKKLKEQVKSPKFICSKCGRVSSSEENICKAVSING